jgi:UDP-glucuronate 4-epimerase
LIVRAVVTGAAGFIGSHLCERLRRDDVEVVGIDGFVNNYDAARKRSHLAQIAEDDGFRLVEGMLEELDFATLLDGVDAVYHLAALPGVRSSWGRSFEAYSSHNVYATQRVLEAAMNQGVSRVVYASSSSVYGDAAELPMSEEARERPHSPYGVTKLAGEHLARLYHRNYGYPTVSLRFFTVYGPRQRPDMAIQRFLEAARDGSPIRIFGTGEQTRDFTFVADTVEALVRAASGGEPGAVYNVGGGSTVSLNQLIATIEEVTGRRLDAHREEAQRGDVGHTRADVARIRAALDFVPGVGLREGLQRHWDWLRTTEGT